VPTSELDSVQVVRVPLAAKLPVKRIVVSGKAIRY
jgi:hypothetical protein